MELFLGRLCLILFNKRGKNVKIQSMRICNVGGIRSLDLKFNSGLNLICGPNGIGKTTIIEAIGNAFSYGNQELKRRAGSEFGEVSIVTKGSATDADEIRYRVEKFRPDENNQFLGNKQYLDLEQIFMFKTHREIPYQLLDSIKRDPYLQGNDLSERIANGIRGDDIKSWFVNRYIFSHLTVSSSLTQEQKENYNIAESCFGILDESVKFKDVVADTFDILLETKNGDIYFEYLSDGYKTCVYILLGIIKEIEYRFKEPHISIKDFNGLIIVDELDLHLHPQWQAGLVKALKQMVPNAQVIATTHSPNMLQAVLASEIIPLSKDESGNVFIKTMKLGEYGLQGWTIEEILEDIMGLPTTLSDIYLNTLSAFDRAMDEENRDKILEQYYILKKMLHPNNPLQRLLKLQVAEWEE